MAQVGVMTSVSIDGGTGLDRAAVIPPTRARLAETAPRRAAMRDERIGLMLRGQAAFSDVAAEASPTARRD
jgi:hypothetical protein